MSAAAETSDDFLPFGLCRLCFVLCFSFLSFDTPYKSGFPPVMSEIRLLRNQSLNQSWAQKRFQWLLRLRPFFCQLRSRDDPLQMRMTRDGTVSVRRVNDCL